MSCRATGWSSSSCAAIGAATPAATPHRRHSDAHSELSTTSGRHRSPSISSLPPRACAGSGHAGTKPVGSAEVSAESAASASSAAETAPLARCATASAALSSSSAFFAISDGVLSCAHCCSASPLLPLANKPAVLALGRPELPSFLASPRQSVVQGSYLGTSPFSASRWLTVEELDRMS